MVMSKPPATAHGRRERLAVVVIGLVAASASIGANADAELVINQVGGDIPASAQPAEGEGNRAGQSVALSADGHRVVFGVPHQPFSLEPGPPQYYTGGVESFDRDGAAWSRGPALGTATDSDRLGTSVALSADGNRIAAGAPGIDGSSAGYVTVRDADHPSRTARLEGDEVNDAFGAAVALSANGNRLAIGAPGLGSSNRFPYSADQIGSVQVFDRDGTTSSWSAVGSKLVGIRADDYFGASVALSNDGTRLAIGAPASGAGRVRVFDWDSAASDWTEISPDPPDKGLGWSVALSADGNRLALGSAGRRGPATGFAIVLDWDRATSTWNQVGERIKADHHGDSYFGESIALSADGSRLVIGAPEGAGYARVYGWDPAGSTWVAVGQRLTGDRGDDNFGESVAISADGRLLAVGAPGGLPTADRNGYVRVFEILDQVATTAPATTILPPGDNLPATGRTGLRPTAELALILLGSGIAVILLTRRRNPRPT